MFTLCQLILFGRVGRYSKEVHIDQNRNMRPHKIKGCLTLEVEGGEKLRKEKVENFFDGI